MRFTTIDHLPNPFLSLLILSLNPPFNPDRGRGLLFIFRKSVVRTTRRRNPVAQKKLDSILILNAILGRAQVIFANCKLGVGYGMFLSGLLGRTGQTSLDCNHLFHRGPFHAIDPEFLSCCSKVGRPRLSHQLLVLDYINYEKGLSELPFSLDWCIKSGLFIFIYFSPQERPLSHLSAQDM